MRHFERFYRNFSFLNSATNLRFIGALQPEFHCLFDHRFRMLRRLALANDAKLRTISDVPPIVSRFNDGSELRKFHHKEFISLSNRAPERKSGGRVIRQGERSSRAVRIIARHRDVLSLPNNFKTNSPQGPKNFCLRRVDRELHPAAIEASVTKAIIRGC